MKFVRWLGAFGESSSLAEAASWERSQVERQVAVEPLWRPEQPEKTKMPHCDRTNSCKTAIILGWIRSLKRREQWLRRHSLKTH